MPNTHCQNLKTCLISSYGFFKAATSLDRAASMAYSTLLAFVPTLVVGLWLTEHGHFSPQAIHHALILILRPLSIEPSHQVVQHLLDFVLQTKQLSWLVYICLAFSTFLLVSNLHSTFDAIWGVQPQKRKWHLTVLHALIIMLLPLILTWITSVESLFLAMERHHVTLTLLANIFDWTHLVLLVLLLACCYAMLPSKKIRFCWAFLSGMTASCAIAVAKKGLTWYFFVAKQYSLLYGSLQAIPIFLLWIYVVWVLILAGCALCRGLSTVAWR